MDSGLLSLKWNNHGSTFFHVLATIRRKESYSDVTLACDGKFYPVHKLVLSTCSDYFEEIFNRTQCKQPVIVLKDVKHEELEALLNYMYLGEVNVLQADLAGLIKAAECLRIKGLAVPDEAPVVKGKEGGKRTASARDISPSQNKRARQEESETRRTTAVSDESRGHRDAQREARQRLAVTSPPTNEGFTNATNFQQSHGQENSRDSIADSERLKETRPSEAQESSPSHVEVVVQEDPIPVVKTEIIDEPKAEEDNDDDSMRSDGGMAYDQMGSGDGVSDGQQNFDPQVLTAQPQTMEELVAQAMPGTSGIQGDSMVGWGAGQSGGSGGDLSRFSLEAFQMDDSQGGSQGSQQQQMGGGGAPSGLMPTAYPPPRPAVIPGPLPPYQPGIGPHMCQFCSRPFFLRSDLTRHLRIHTGEKPFKCPYCEHNTARKSSLKKHLLSKHTTMPNIDLDKMDMSSTS